MGTELLPPVVIMGVSGCGKSTVGSLLSERLDVAFRDGDDLHPAANKEKMAAGVPLDDSDRKPWLEDIGRALGTPPASGSIIIACSALKRSYRDILRKHEPAVIFVHLTADRGTLLARMKQRQHEFMPSSLLDSQLTTLEPLLEDERHIIVDVGSGPVEVVDEIAARLQPFATNGTGPAQS